MKKVWHHGTELPNEKGQYLVHYQGTYQVWLFMGYWFETASVTHHPDEWASLKDILKCSGHEDN